MISKVILHICFTQQIFGNCLLKQNQAKSHFNGRIRFWCSRRINDFFHKYLFSTPAGIISLLFSMILLFFLMFLLPLGKKGFSCHCNIFGNRLYLLEKTAPSTHFFQSLIFFIISIQSLIWLSYLQSPLNLTICGNWVGPKGKIFLDCFTPSPEVTTSKLW